MSFQESYGNSNPVGMSVPEFCQTLITMLSTKRSSEDLQNEFFDLIGFDRFELIQTLFEHREDIVRASNEAKVAAKNEIMAAAARKELDYPRLFGVINLNSLNFSG